MFPPLRRWWCSPSAGIAPASNAALPSNESLLSLFILSIMRKCLSRSHTWLGQILIASVGSSDQYGRYHFSEAIPRIESSPSASTLKSHYVFSSPNPATHPHQASSSVLKNIIKPPSPSCFHTGLPSHSAAFHQRPCIMRAMSYLTLYCAQQ